MASNNSITTQIRIPEKLYLEIKEISSETGGNLNSTMLHLIHVGKRIYSDGFIIPPKLAEWRLLKYGGAVQCYSGSAASLISLTSK